MSFVIYALIGLMPGDPIDQMLTADPHLTAADAARLKALYGLDRPLAERYLAWARSALAGDFGYSRLYATPAVAALMPRLGNTALLMLSSFVLALAIALPLGAAGGDAHRRQRRDLSALHARRHDRDAAPGLRAHRARQGGERAARGMGARVPERARPRHHRGRALLRLALLRRAHHRDHVRLSRHGQAHLRRHPRQRLQPGAGGIAVRDLAGAAVQSRRRHRLCRGRSADHLPMSTALARSASSRWRRAFAVPQAAASASVLGAICLAVALAPLIAALLGADAHKVDLYQRLAPPSLHHPLGTDELGRDLLLRLLEGGRVSLFVGISAALGAAGLGTAVGLVAGYRGGRIDAALMRLTDGVIALPLLPLLVVLAAIDLRKLGLPAWLVQSEAASLYRIIVLVSLVGWTTVARLVRGATLSLRAQDFVRAALALGASPRRIMLVHILPNLASPIIVAATLSVGHMILLESVLSFLGLGIEPPLPSWGNMLTGAQETIGLAPQLALYPGLLIFLTVIACNFLGDALQDALDPRATRR